MYLQGDESPSKEPTFLRGNEKHVASYLKHVHEFIIKKTFFTDFLTMLSSCVKKGFDKS